MGRKRKEKNVPHEVEFSNIVTLVQVSSFRIVTEFNTQKLKIWSRYNLSFLKLLFLTNYGTDYHHVTISLTLLTDTMALLKC